jgi:phosphoribosylformimino-5-aminoimidazole carboxamide ribotide isomerase
MSHAVVTAPKRPQRLGLILYPAIDLLDAQAVRLRQGRRDDATVFGEPVAFAEGYARAGADWLHVVDLNGAFDNARAANAAVIRALVKSSGLKVQVGGGVRTTADIEELIGLGVNRVIIGTRAVEDPAWVAEVAARYPGQVVVGVDAREGLVAVKGWAETSSRHVFDVVAGFEGSAVAGYIYTDIARDGVGTGVNVAATEALADRTAKPVIASGGVHSLDDIRVLAAGGKAEGVIIGRALYDRRFTLEAALAVGTERAGGAD